jgi:hypothetical protein
LIISHIKILLRNGKAEKLFLQFSGFSLSAELSVFFCKFFGVAKEVTAIVTDKVNATISAHVVLF